MASSVQRTIIMTLAIQLLMSISLMYLANNNTYDAYINEDGRDLRNHSSQYISKYENPNPETNANIFETQFGDQKEGGKGWWELLKYGLGIENPCETTGTYCDALDSKIGWLLRWGIMGINLILLLELFFMIYSKKNT